MANSVWLGPFGFVNNGSQIVFTLPGAFPDGTVAAPGITFTNIPNDGWFKGPATRWTFSADGVSMIGFYGDTTGIQLKSTYPLAWASGNINSANDVGISRSAAGTLAVGNGTQGDVSGTVAATLYKSGANTGVTTFGPAAVASITVKGGIVTAIS